MNKNFKYLVTRIVGVFLLLIISNLIYIAFLLEDDLDEHAYVLNDLKDLDADTDAIYFGESSNFHITEEETYKHRISEMLDSLLPNTKVGTVDHSGLHAGNYLSLIKRSMKRR